MALVTSTDSSKGSSMKVEYIRIYADDLGLQNIVAGLLYAHRCISGEFSYTARSKAKAQAQYKPEVARLSRIIRERINKVLPEYADYEWTARRDHNVNWVKIKNPDW